MTLSQKFFLQIIFFTIFTLCDLRGRKFTSSLHDFSHKACLSQQQRKKWGESKVKSTNHATIEFTKNPFLLPLLLILKVFPTKGAEEKTPGKKGRKFLCCSKNCHWQKSFSPRWNHRYKNFVFVPSLILKDWLEFLFSWIPLEGALGKNCGPAVLYCEHFWCWYVRP